MAANKKTLGDIAKFYRGLTYSKGDEVEFSSKAVLRSNNVELETNSLVLSDLKYLRDDLDIDDDKKVKTNSILICMSNGSKQHIGKVAFIKDNLDLAFGGFMGLILPDHKVNAKYVYYSCISSAFKHFLSGVGNGIGITNLRFTDLSTFTFPVPATAEQERIVAELDCLSDIIEKQKQQLKELDNLAQSIFYTTFGDPISNNFGWELKQLGNCFCHIKNGANIKQEKGAGGIPITRIETLSGGVFNRDRLGYADLQEVGKYEKYVLNTGDLLLSHINSKVYIGRTVAYRKVGNEKIIHGMNLLRLIPNADTIHPIYMQYFSYTDMFKGQIANRRKDAVNQSSISVADLKTVSIPIPPFALQQEFASKVDAIEKQKEIIKQSIEETETLFNSRMDYYFN